jgi:hypothetical protein
MEFFRGFYGYREAVGCPDLQLIEGLCAWFERPDGTALPRVSTLSGVFVEGDLFFSAIDPARGGDADVYQR